MKNKYYKPNLEEFHVGFEYEAAIADGVGDGEDVWVKQKWGELNSLSETMTLRYNKDGSIKISVPDSIRVKLLDRDDIIDLGFDEKIENMYHIKVGEYRGERDRVFSLFVAGVTLIYLHRGNGEFATVFTGIINNKSELRRVLKQVGIIK